MPLPSPKMKALFESVYHEMFTTPAPFFGVNVLDVNEANLVEVQTRMQKVGAPFANFPGFGPFFRAVSDYGDRKRILVINRYDQDIDRDKCRTVIYDNPQAQEDWEAAFEVMEDYEFFTTREIS